MAILSNSVPLTAGQMVVETWETFPGSIICGSDVLPFGRYGITVGGAGEESYPTAMYWEADGGPSGVVTIVGGGDQSCSIPGYLLYQVE